MFIKKLIIVLTFFCLILTVNAQEIRILTTEEPPTNYTSGSGKITGTTTDIIEAIKKELNITVSIEMMPWARAYKISKNKSNIIIYTASKTQERIDMGFHFIGPVTTRKHILMSKKESDFNIKNLEDVKKQKLTIGTMKGDWRSNYFRKQGFRVDDVPMHEQNIKKLIRKRFDLWATSDIEAPLIAKQAGINISEIKQAFIFKEASSYILLSKNTSSEIVKKWQNAYQKIQATDFFEKTSKKWSAILGFELLYSKNKGFFIK